MTGGTYGSDATELFYFGPNREGVDEIARDIVDRCRRKGIEVGGPHTPPTVRLDSDHPAFSDGPDAELFGQPPTEEELEAVADTAIFTRKVLVFNGGNVLKDLLSTPLQEGVFVRAHVDQRAHRKGGDSAPFTYDANLDYVTEL